MVSRAEKFVNVRKVILIPNKSILDRILRSKKLKSQQGNIFDIINYYMVDDSLIIGPFLGYSGIYSALSSITLGNHIEVSLIGFAGSFNNKADIGEIVLPVTCKTLQNGLGQFSSNTEIKFNNLYLENCEFNKFKRVNNLTLDVFEPEVNDISQLYDTSIATMDMELASILAYVNRRQYTLAVLFIVTDLISKDGHRETGFKSSIVKKSIEQVVEMLLNT